jgi:thioredoxin reductase (NADPH)
MADTSTHKPTEIDALVVGAGPVGLFQVFQLGLQEVHAHVVDSLPHAGGQCATLYPDKPIYDIPGIPVCTGQELVDRLLQQVQPFAPSFHFGQVVSELHRQPDGRFLVRTAARAGAAEQAFLTKTVFIAAGAGAFQPRTLKVEGLDAFEGSQLHYTADNTALAGADLVIVGDGDLALEAALQYCPQPNKGPTSDSPRSVTVVHRRDVLSAADSTVARFREQVAQGHLRFVAAQVSAVRTEGGRLATLDLLHSDGVVRGLPVDQLWVLQGLSPKLGPIADWGLALQRRQLAVDTETFSTSQAGIFAVGDINLYPGKKKLIVCGFHECVLAAFGAMQYIAPERNVPLQYTTTSTQLHRLLGVEHPTSAGQNSENSGL